MKRGMKILKLIIFMAVVFVLSEGSCLANIGGSDFLVDVGKNFYKQGRIDDAVHEFSKALILNPDNREAKRCLEVIGLDEGLYTTPQTKNAKIVELSRNVKSYEGMVQELSSENAQLKGSYHELDRENQTLLQEKQDLDVLVKAGTLEVEVLNGKTMFYKNKIEGENFDNVSEAVKETAQAYSSRHAKIIAEKKALEQQLASAESVGGKDDLLRTRLNAAVDASIRMEKAAFSIAHRYDDLKERNQRLYDYQDKLIKVLEDYLRLRETKLNDVSDKLVYKQLDLADSEERLINRLEELIASYDRFEEYKRSFNKN